MSIQLINMQSRAIGQDNNKLKKPNNLNMTYYFIGLCKELVVFRVCSNSSTYIYNLLISFWGCSVTWLITQRSGYKKNAAIGVQNSFFARKIIKADESPRSPI